MRPRIVQTITGATTEEVRLAREAAEAAGDADILELRVDGVQGLDLPALLTDRRAPVIVTCRPAWEGGRYEGAEPDRLRLLRRARALGAEFIDVEFRADWRSVLRPPQVEGREAATDGIILSLHDFTGVPADLDVTARTMRQAGADIVKIAVTPTRLADCVRLAEIGRSLPSGVVVGMGAKGLTSRLAPDLFNACWTYAGALGDIGQLAAHEMRAVYGVGRAQAPSALYGVVGKPIAHSFSPRLHNAAFQAAGVDARYLPFEAESFDDFLTFARAFAVRGVSVTAPFKGDALAVSVSVDEDARLTGAANTLLAGPDGWVAANTDIAGFLAPLGHLDLNGMRTAVIGRGGAARAAARALENAGASVTFIARADISRAEEPWDLLVNATPVGTAPDVDASVMAGRAIRARRVYDLVYNPVRTRLLEDAGAAGAEIIGGMAMLVAQACRQFECWFGRSAPVEAYRAAAVKLASHETDDVRRVR